MKSAPSRKEFRKHMLCFIRRTHLGSVVATFRWSSVGGGQVVSQIASQELPCTRLHSPPPLHHYHLPIHLLLLHQLLLLLLLLFLLLLPLLVLMLSLPPPPSNSHNGKQTICHQPIDWKANGQTRTQMVAQRDEHRRKTHRQTHRNNPKH